MVTWWWRSGEGTSVESSTRIGVESKEEKICCQIHGDCEMLYCSGIILLDLL